MPTLLSITDNIRKLFNAYPGDDKKSSVLNILEHFSTSHNEGVDPTNIQVFETSHPYPLNDQQRKIVSVPRAIGYLIEIDPRSSISSHNC